MTRLHDWLTRQAECRPDAAAVVFQQNTATYQALEEASNRLARALKAAGCARGDRVGLLLTKSIGAVTAMFGALKADCTYVPLDTAGPAARIERILGLCECRCVLAERSTASLLNELVNSEGWQASTRIGWMDGGASLDGHAEIRFSHNHLRSFSGAPVDSRSEAGDPAHILFTSGSTGTPKGVVITHSNVNHFVRWAIGHFGISPQDRISGHSPFHFDLSTFDIYGSIAAGAQLHLLAPEISLLPHRLAEFIREAELTQWFSVPSVLQHMRQFDVVTRNDFPSLRRLLWCGEKLLTPTLRYWMRRLPHVTFTNLYGPTEATIASSFHQLPVCPEDDAAEIPIGTACPGEFLLVLNERLEAGPWEIGELYIGGAGLSPGYWRDPERTKEAFIPNPCSSHAGERIYKTGDLARIGEDGTIYLLGRTDSQIKSRGYRIELGEVETAISAIPKVHEAAVVAIDSAGVEGKALCCAYTPLADSELSVPELKRRLARALPRYMIPTHWMALESMPRTGNGKTDRRTITDWFRQRPVAPKVKGAGVQ
jgi:amino acid adenylation domain-containing protein